MENTAEQFESEDELYEGELSETYPLSPLFALKKSFPFMCFLAIPMAIFAFGDKNALTAFENLRNAIGLKQFMLYYFGCGMLALLVGYWFLYIRTFSYGVSEGMFYIRKGVFVKQYFDYPITSIENVGIRRGFLDAILGLCNIQIFTAHEASDDLAAIQGLPVGLSEEVHKYIRSIMTEYQASRQDITSLKTAVKRTATR